MDKRECNTVRPVGAVEEPAAGAGRWDRLPEDYPFTRADIKRNMFCCILMDAFFSFGWADMQIALMPLLIFLGASNKTIGFVNGMNWMIFLGLTLSPWISRRFEYKKKYFFMTNIPYLFPILVGGVITLVGAQLGWSKELLLSAIIWAFAFHWILGGFVSLPHTEYIAACIPANHRATMNGMSVSVGSALGLLSTAVGYFVLERVSKPAAYGVLFIMTWVLIQSGYLAALLAKERRTPVESSPQPWSRGMIRAFRDDKRYVRFVVLAGTFSLFLGGSAFNFINAYGLKDLGMLPKTAAIMGTIQLIVRILSAGPLGAAIDRIGAKSILPWLGVAGAFVFLPLVILRSPVGVYSSIALSVLFFSANMAAFAVLQYGLPKPEDRSGHFTILIMVQVLAGSAGSYIIGCLADVIGYITTFQAVSVIALLLVPFTWFVARDFPARTSEFH